MSFLFINKTLPLNNLKARKAINAKFQCLLFVLRWSYIFYSKPLNSGHLRALKNCPLLWGGRYWKVIIKRLSYLGLKVLFAIHGMSTIWDVRYWEVSLYIICMTVLLMQNFIFCAVRSTETPKNVPVTRQGFIQSNSKNS